MKSKILLSLSLLFALAISLQVASADLGTFKKGDCIQIRVPTNQSTLYANISTITYPNGLIAYENLSLQPINSYTYNRTYCDTSNMGVYVYDYYTSDNSATIPNSFTITANGKPYTYFPIEYMIILTAMIFLIFGRYLGRKFKTDMWDTFAGILFMIAGILTLTEGFNYVDYSTLAGQTLGFILIGIGAVVTYYSNSEVFD